MLSPAFRCIDLLPLDERTVHPVFTVDELNEISKGIPHGAVVADRDVLLRLDRM